MDTTDPEITFNNKGYCNHCIDVVEHLKKEPFCLTADEKKRKLNEILEEVKSAGRSNKYDTIIGVSGGIDSTYVAHLVKKWDLRPLAVHLDNGWNTELSVKNVEHICRKLDIDLYTKVLDWDEFRNLQIAFLKSSTTDAEIPTDHAILAILYEMAAKNKIKYIMAGTNYATESILPARWSTGYYDWLYIKSLWKKFGSGKWKTFPHFGRFKLYSYRKFKGIQWIEALNYVDYNKEKAKEFMHKKIGWKDYGSKHGESLYTKFHIGHILPTKFNIDKRRAHLASLIMAGQMTREEALEELEKPLYTKKKMEKDKEYVVMKLGLTMEEFDEILALPPKTYWDYPGYANSRVTRFLRWVRRKER
jgi:N-acetyl sugar amidotransferase